MIKHHEFWPPRLFEIPYYLYLGLQCLRRGIGVKTLAKANYGLDHGEIGLGSKYQSQCAFNQDYFLPTVLIPADLSLEEKKQQMRDFVQRYGYPAILKSDVGCVGKGICKLASDRDIEHKAPLLLGDYILQQFTPFACEYGVFFVRERGVPRVTGINKKHFPTVVGNGRDTLLQLAQGHERYSEHWPAFLQSLDTARVPAPGEEVRLSFIGSHTLGCKFTDDSALLTPALERAVYDFFESQPGFNFGRCDIKAESEAAFQRGEFVVIEVNGVASLPTHMFDPQYRLGEAYGIFFEHARYLAKIAQEHRQQAMPLLPYRQVLRRVRANQSLLNRVHALLKGGGA